MRAPGEGTRPLSDRVKQALFALVESEVPGAWRSGFLDLFAGSGAGGIEALSRGAPVAVFVERDPGAARVIEQNLRRTGLSAGVVVRREAVAWLAAGPAGVPGAPFGVALIDPPYGRPDLVEACLAHLGDPSSGWLRDDGGVVVKHFWRDAPGQTTGWLRRVRERRFGETAVSLYRVSAAGEGGRTS